MANYAFSFATVAAYKSAKNSGGTAEIYNALVPSSTTGSTTNVSRAAVSFIAELGRAVVDSVNVCVPYAEGGFVGDVLCYNSTYGYFWMKSPRASWDANSLGQTYYDSTTFPSGFVRVGYCFHREGKHGLITEITNGEGKAWRSSTGSISGVYTTTQVPCGTRGKYGLAAIKEVSETINGSSYNQYAWPIPRTLWDAACAAAKSGITSSGSAGSCSWSSSGGVATISSSFYSYGSFTVNPADYDYNFDRWYRDNVEAIIPGPAGTVTSMEPIDGVKHDGVRNTRLMYLDGNSPAANRAVAYSVSAPNHGAGMWWIPQTVELIRLMKVRKTLQDNGAGIALNTVYWSSDQCNAGYAWYVDLTIGYVDYNPKTNGFQVRLVSAFEIS